jgi:thioredoxin 1
MLNPIDRSRIQVSASGIDVSSPREYKRCVAFTNDGPPKELGMASANVLEFGNDNWQTEVVQSPIPVLVDFWAPWCAPCRALLPTIEKLADQFVGKVKVGKVNVDDNMEVAAQYGVSGIPRLLVFKGGPNPVQSISGLKSEAELAAMLRTVSG